MIERPQSELSKLIKTKIMGYTNQPKDVWQHQVTKLKLIFPQLTEDDFKYDNGKKEVMMMKLQNKLGKSREQLNSLLTDL